MSAFFSPWYHCPFRSHRHSTNILFFESINDGLIKVTAEHDFWTLEDADDRPGDIDRWRWRQPTQLQIGNKLLDNGGNLIEITSLENIEGEVEVINFDVEPLDIYFASGVLVHNKGTDSNPTG